MTLVAADRVKETTTTTGTGNISLSGAVSGYRTFSSVCANGDTLAYCIEGASDWEVGIGTYNSGTNTLSRTTVTASSNAGALVNFSAETKNIFLTLLSDQVRTKLNAVAPTYPITTDMKLRLSAEFSTITRNTDNRIAQINDMTGVWGNFTATTTARPRFRKIGFNGFKPCFVFDGIATKLSAVSTFTLAQPCSVIAVVQNWSLGSVNANLFRDSNGGAVTFINASNSWAIFAGVANLISTALFQQNNESSLDAVKDSAPAVVISVFNGASSLISNNGVEVTGSPGTSAFSGTLKIGGDNGTSFARMLLYEFVIVGHALTLTERQNINTYYSNLCDIQL